MLFLYQIFIHIRILWAGPLRKEIFRPRSAPFVLMPNQTTVMILTNPEHKIIFMNGIDKVKSIEDLKQFLRFPSISTDSSKKSSVADCAKWLCNYLKKIGLQRVVLHPTK